MVCFQKFFARLLSFLLFVSFLGAGERGPSSPFITGDTFRSHADHVFDETVRRFYPKKVKFGDIVFVKTDWEYLEIFFNRYHPEIESPYILLTHNSDHGAPGPFRKYLNDPKLLGWFAQNVEGEFHPKLHPIPIGIANKCWDHGNPWAFSSFLPSSKNSIRTILCYMNFEPSTYLKERSYVRDLFASKPWCVVSKSKPMIEYLQDLTCSKFVLSPRGNGLDCHRTWEALLMGAIPIVRSSSLDRMYENLPVLIIDDWKMITEDFLNEQYEIIKGKSYDLEKIFIDYWIQQIHSERRQ